VTTNGDSQDLLEAMRDADVARQTVEYLKAGHALPVVQSSMMCVPDEREYGRFGAALHTYSGTDAVIPGSAFVAFGSPLFMIGSMAASAAFNSSRKKKALAAAAPQWRLDNTGELHVTSQRLALQGVHGWYDFWYYHMRAIEVTRLGLILHYADHPMVRIECASPIWVWAIVKYFASGEFVDIPALGPGPQGSITHE
jgi:hypothetical protein